MSLATQNLVVSTRQRQQASPYDAPGAVALSEVVSALSFALDSAKNATPGHAVRTCLLGMRIASALGLPESDLQDLYYALLLKDLLPKDTASLISRNRKASGTDNHQTAGSGNTLELTPISLSHRRTPRPNETTALRGWSLWQRAKHVFNFSLSREPSNPNAAGLHRKRGADIVCNFGLSEQCADAIHARDEHWNGGGHPDQLRGEAAPLLARIVGVAQFLDRSLTEQGQSWAIESLQEQSGTRFDPELVRIAVALHRACMLWSGCEAGPLGAAAARYAAMDMEPGTPAVIDSSQIDKVCEAFAGVVDARSPFTYRHSTGVTETADALAAELGLRPNQRKLIHRAALLHDLGKLSVSSEILNKPGQLEPHERATVQKYPLISERILERIPSFKGVARIAGRHHERLDGSGYPNQLTAQQLSIEDSIVAMADIYSALSEDRPHRPALAPDQILNLLSKDVPNKLDAEVFEALQRFVKRSSPSNRILQIPLPTRKVNVAEVQQLVSLSHQYSDILDSTPTPARF